MDGQAERNSPKDAQTNAQMLLALLSHSEELRKGNHERKYDISFPHYSYSRSLDGFQHGGPQKGNHDAHPFVRIFV